MLLSPAQDWSMQYRDGGTASFTWLPLSSLHPSKTEVRQVLPAQAGQQAGCQESFYLDLGLTLISSMTLGKIIYLAGPQFLQMKQEAWARWFQECL